MGHHSFSVFALQNFVHARISPHMNLLPGEADALSSKQPYRCNLSVIVITSQKARQLELSLQQVAGGLQKIAANFEFIVVQKKDGKQRDRVDEEACPFCHRHYSEMNRDVTRRYQTLAEGIGVAKEEITLLLDLDRQWNIHELARFLPMTAHYDIVLGFSTYNHSFYGQALARWLWSTLVHFVLGIKVHDINCLFHLYPTKCLKQLHLETQGLLLNTEILYKCLRAGYIYTEIAVTSSIYQHALPVRSKWRTLLLASYQLFLATHKWHMEELGLFESGK